MSSGNPDSPQEEFYIDAKGRTRWRVNDSLAVSLKRLYDFLVIGNYEESHAARYPRLAHAISRYPEPITVLKAENRLQEIPGVSDIISGIIVELLETGSCKKMLTGDEFFTPPPMSVLELTAVPRLGAKTAKKLYQDHGIKSFLELREAAENGDLGKISGVGPSMISTILNFEESNQ